MKSKINLSKFTDDLIDQGDYCAQDVINLRDEIIRLRKLIKWKDIKTAPKDGTLLLLLDKNSGRQVVGNWCDTFEMLDFNKEKGDHNYKGAWTDYTVASWCYEEYAEFHPTHYLELLPTK